MWNKIRNEVTVSIVFNSTPRNGWLNCFTYCDKIGGSGARAPTKQILKIRLSSDFIEKKNHCKTPIFWRVITYSTLNKLTVKKIFFFWTKSRESPISRNFRWKTTSIFYYRFVILILFRITYIFCRKTYV